MSKTVTHPLKAFLCHASGDKPMVREMYKRLVFEGVDAWLDKEKLLPGQDWRVEIPKAVRESDVVIVFLSKNSITREGYVQKEIKDALDVAEEKPEGAIFLIPARLEECPVPERLGRWQWVDLFEDNGFIQLLRSLKLRANAVGATVEPTAYQESDGEVTRRVEQLYTEGLAAFYTEEWDKACQRFQLILREHPNHTNAAEKLAEAEKQGNLARLYARAGQEYRDENWPAAIQSLEELLKKSAEYKDATQLLRNARKQKQLGELYTEAKALHTAQKWHAVLKVFEQIAAIEPACPDPDGLLPSAQKEVAELKRIADLNEQYSLAVRRMDAGEWLEARTLLEKVHKSQTGFMETERLLRKAENEIAKAEDQNRRSNQVNTLYEQAHGLIRSKNWRKVLDKMEEIQRLDSQFEDKDGITGQAKSELAREEQEAQRQNELAAMYAESARLMQEGKYQEALDKWDEVRAVDPKYPDRQWVQRTAKKKLAEMTKPVKVKPQFAMPKLPWKRIAAIVVAVAAIIGIVLLLQDSQSTSPEPTAGNTTSILPAATSIPNKISTPRPATPIPTAGGYADPTMYDDFDIASYNGTRMSYNKTLWRVYASSASYNIFQQGGDLSVKVFDQADAGLEANDFLYIDKPAFVETRMYLDPSTTDNDSHFFSYFYIQDHGGINCGIFSHKNDTQDIKCWSEFYGKEVEANLGLDGIPPAWHVIRLEIEPETMTISYIIDGRKVGAFVPNDSIPEHFDEFKQSNFHFKFAMNNFGPSKAPHGYIDYVRVGAIEDDPQIFIYDDFGNASLDGAFDPALWEIAYGGGSVYQENGNLAFYVDNKGQEWLYAGLIARRYSNYQFTHPISFESRMSLDTGDVGGIFMQIQSVEGNLRYGCGIETIDTSHVKCIRLEHGKVSDIAYAEYKRSTWHTFRFTVVPGEKKIYYYMDGEPVGSLVSEYPHEFSTALYNLYIQGFTYNTGEAVGLIDYVRVGAIEDDPTNAESFFWAVGEWESTDATDKSHLTMSIKRDSAGQYTFVLADSSAGFCDGGSGKADFRAETFSNTAAGAFEFVCDSSGRRGNFEYQFTYNRTSDQIVSADGITWNRKK